ncbi:anti-anti-sigma-B factor [Oceanobacillus picturae]|jgi:anti-sigma B factor antagonist|uniref:Anti-sigma factor antagonist n=1 Tax=Oceanobacillus picturae TaxID=171693 RepID=W9AND4_9BACI|nr:STAS domain-containing protein [Oceanobacillus picturae]RIU89109.1 anti-sigma factor antagonist [Oceanobacillus picturae]GAQ17766.1 anti-anti-sigma-B factor [Oceanobacillus picturae]CDO04126.1 Anti-anti-sigma-B factor [Oceanobacillus picturae]
MNLVIDVVEESNKSVVNLSGEIDAYTAPNLKESLLPLTQKEGNTVEVDLGNVNYMDSTGLGVFISALKSTKENGSEMKLVNIQDRVLRLFKITGLDEIMDLNSTIRGVTE